jgi:hypothetical protein
VQSKVLVLLHILLQLQHDGRQTPACVVELHEFSTLLRKLSTLLANCACHSFDALQQFLVGRVRGGGREQESIVADEVSVDQTAPLHHKVVRIVHTENLPHRLFQRHVDIQHFLVLLALLVVHQHGSKGGLHKGPALSTFLKHGDTVRVMWGWLPGSAAEMGTCTIVDVEHGVNHMVKRDLSDPYLKEGREGGGLGDSGALTPRTR